MPKVFVTDGRSIATIPIVKSLAEKGIEVTCGEEYHACPAFFSRYVKHRIIYPSPEKEPDLFIQKMYDIVKKDKYDLIMPVRDAATVLLSKHKEDFSKFTNIPVADYAIIMKGRNKAQTLKVAMENDIPCPKTYFPEEQSLEEIRDSTGYPVLIRPCESSGSRGIRFVDSPKKLKYEYGNVRRQYGQTFIQEYIPTEEGRYTLHALLDQNSNPKATFVIKGVRGYPIKSGPVSLAESAENTDILEYGLSLLKALNWYGVAGVEFLFDKRDKKPKLMEVNPRFGNAVGLDIQSGVNLPYMLYRMAMGDNIEPVFKYTVGIKWRWLLPQDILWFLSSPHKGGSAKEFSKFRDKDLHYAALSLSDPGPAVGIILQGAKFLANKEKRDFMFKRGWR